MNKALVYIRWSDQSKVWADHTSPTLLAIATVRRQNRDIPIYVYDTSVGSVDYGDYPDLLGFEVRHWQHHHAGPSQPGWCNDSLWRLLSKPYDLSDILSSLPHRHVAYLDSDILWRTDPAQLFEYTTPVASAYQNSGVIVLDKLRCMDYLSRWQALTSRAIDDKVLRADLVRTYYGPLFTEEAAMSRLNDTATDWTALHPKCNYQLLRPDQTFNALSWNYHFIGYRFGSDRVQYMLSIDEFHTALREVLGDRLAEFGAARKDPGSVPLSNIGSLFLR